jgi:serine/threonine protein kinase
VKLLDFGVARLRDPTASADRLTWTGIVVGTPSYLAPELWQGATADERSDVYALGATLHFLVSGAPPSVRQAQDDAGLPASHANYDLRPDALGEIVRRCLASSPADRFQSAHELREALARVYDADAWTRADAEDFWRQLDRRRFGA